jgi:hypothetical protein
MDAILLKVVLDTINKPTNHVILVRKNIWAKLPQKYIMLMSRSFGFVATKDLFGFLIVQPDECYSRNSSCASSTPHIQLDMNH